MSLKVGELYADITLRDQEFNRTVDGAHRKFGGLGSAIQSTGAKIGAGLVAFGIGRWLAGSIDVVHAYEVTIARLKTVVEATGGSWDVYSKKMKDVVDKESQISAFSGGELRGSLADLTQVTGNASKGLDLLALSADLARGKQMDLQTASKLVGKVAMGNYAVLARYGIIIKAGTSATDALAQLQARFAGQAKAYGDTSAGAQDKLNNALKKLQLTVGTAVVPALTTLAGILVVVLNHFNSLPGPVKTVVVGIAALATAAALLAPFVGTIKSIIGGIGGLIARLGGSAAAIGVETTAIEANTAAKVENAAAGGGIGRGALPLGTPVAAPPIGGAMGGPFSWMQLAGMSAMSVGGAGVEVGKELPIDMIAKRNPAVAQQVKKLNDIKKALDGVKPSAATVGMLAKYDKQLATISSTTHVNSLRNQADAMRAILKKQSKDFETSSEASALAVGKAATAIIHAYSTMADFIKATNKAVVMGTPLPTAAQAAFASQSSQATAFAALTDKQRIQMYNANRQRLKNNPPSMYAGTESHPSISSRAPNPAIHVHFHGPVVGGKAGLRELSGMVQRDVMSGVRRGLVGQNA